MVTAFALNCPLKASPALSSTDLLLDELLDERLAALAAHGVQAAIKERVADHNVRPGVTSDEGDGGGWPALRQQILDP